MKVICHYCNKEAEKVTGSVMYPHREDLSHLIFWRCVPCKAHVGTHKQTDGIPLGKLANEADRMARRLAHSRFDLLWRVKKMPRSLAYQLLSAHMGMTREQCHIGNFTKEQCDKVERFCDIYYEKLRKEKDAS